MQVVLCCGLQSGAAAGWPESSHLAGGGGRVQDEEQIDRDEAIEELHAQVRERRAIGAVWLSAILTVLV